MRNSRTKFNAFFYIFFVIVFVGLVSMNMILLNVITKVDGDARLINYLGLVRGSSQRLVKQELQGIDADDKIQYIQDILSEIDTGNGKNNIIKVDNPKFKSQLSILLKDWETLKKSIYNFREDNDKDRLYEVSEYFFLSANDMVFVAESVSNQKLNLILRLKIFLVVFVIITTIVFVLQLKQTNMLNNDVKELDIIAKKDKLTGLYNRRACDEEIEKYVMANSLDKFACICMDLDNLKYFNDNYGHFVGDKLIELFARALHEVFSSIGFVSRNGGDEFVIFIENTNEDNVKSLIEKLDYNVREKNLREKIIKISYSYGYVVSREEDKHSIYDIMEIADKNMYDYKTSRKRNGKMQNR